MKTATAALVLLIAVNAEQWQQHPLEGPTRRRFPRHGLLVPPLHSNTGASSGVNTPLTQQHLPPLVQLNPGDLGLHQFQQLQPPRQPNPENVQSKPWQHSQQQLPPPAQLKPRQHGQQLQVPAQANPRQVHPNLWQRRQQEIPPPVQPPHQPHSTPIRSAPPKKPYLKPETWAVPEDIACDLPFDEGKCRGRIMRFGYNPTTNDCVPFKWTGCGGNLNRFETRETCEKACRKL